METQIKRDPRGQGERGEVNAALWFADRGAYVFVPVLHTPRDFDFIVDWGEGEGPQTVQVKTSTVLRKDGWNVAVCTRGGNRSWNGVAKKLDSSRYDYLFVVVADGRRWLIPAAYVDGGAGIRLGGPKYAPYEIDAGEPL